LIIHQTSQRESDTEKYTFKALIYILVWDVWNGRKLHEKYRRGGKTVEKADKTWGRKGIEDKSKDK